MDALPPPLSQQNKAEHLETAEQAKLIGSKAMRALDAALLENERVWEDLLKLTGSDSLTRDQINAIIWNDMHPERHTSPNFYT